MKMNQGPTPLEGLKVVDMASFVAGPITGRILADLGAEVIRVETPGGDPMRTTGLMYGMPVADEENPTWALPNSNKKMLVLNLKNPDAMEALHRLLAAADVFLVNVRQKALVRMGLDYEALKDKYPHLIYAHLTGYGYEGEEADLPAFDYATFWARSGMVDWHNTGTPADPSVAFGDIFAGTTLFGGVMTALYAREKTGKGTLVATSLLNTGLWASMYNILSAQPPYNFAYPRTTERGSNPFSANYECKDGTWMTLVLTPLTQANWEKALDAFGLDQYRGDARYGSSVVLLKNNTVAEVVATMREVMKTRTAAEWQQRMNDFDIVASIMIRAKDVYLDEQARTNGFLQSYAFPSGAAPFYPTVPMQFSMYSQKPVEAGIEVSFGRHTDEVLAAAGYSEEEIKKMREEKSVL